jgi:hypothetical protein
MRCLMEGCQALHSGSSPLTGIPVAPVLVVLMNSLQ